MGTETARHIELDGCYNFRDLGGYAARDGCTVRQGRLFRSDALHHLTGEDVTRIREELGLRLVIDVRSEHEVRSTPPSPLVEPPVRYHNVPFFSSEGPRMSAADRGRRRSSGRARRHLGDRYFELLAGGGKQVARMLELIAAADEPAVFHCAAGKDRTGMLSAVILGLLGVSERDIIEDYALTSRNIERIVDRLFETPSYQSTLDTLPPETLHANPQSMESLLALVREEWGSMLGYAEWCGVLPATLAQLDAALLDRA